MSLRPDSYEERVKRARKRDQWRRESVRRYEERKRAEGGKHRSIGSNPERRKKRYERGFGEKADWIRDMCCIVCGHTEVDPHHEPPRARGGTKDDLVPLCPGHHTLKDTSRHKLGSVERFEEVHGVNLEAKAREIEERWRAKNE